MSRDDLGMLPPRLCFSLISLIAIAGYNFWLKEGLEIQLIILIILIISTGLPHGAIDPGLARKVGLWSGGSGLLKFSIGYLSISLMIVGFWFLLPELIIISMLFLSAWHFSADWIEYYPRPTCLAISTAVICLPTLFYPTECIEIFNVLAPMSSQMIVSAMALLSIAVTLFVSFCILSSSKKNVAVMTELVALLFAAIALPPIAYFTVYFCFLHSPLHLKNSLEKLGVFEILLYAVPFTILSMGGGAYLFMSLPRIEISYQLMQVVFVGLFALTVPHMLLIALINQKQLES
tara:strand:+ start:59 stop:931 length:873 start_codon:yes stop_codon:yes gene_type:complete